MAARRKLLTGYPYCEIGPVLAFACGLDIADVKIVDRALANCNRRSQGMHERRKRSAQGALAGPNVMAACIPCNGWVEDNPRIAHALGLVVRPGDPEWDEFGAAPSKVVPFPRSVP